MTKKIIKILVREIKRLRMNNKKNISWKNSLCFVFMGIITILTICLFSLSNQDKQTLISFQEKSRNEKQLLVNAFGIGGGINNNYTERDISEKIKYLIDHYNLTTVERTFTFLGYPFEKPEEAYLICQESQFCYRKKDAYFHAGIDISSFADYNIRSIHYGRVSHVIKHDLYFGNYVVISQWIEGYEYRFTYAHLSNIYVMKNEVVKKGQRIGLMGSEGKLSTGNHLHLQIERLEKKGWEKYNYFSKSLFGDKYYLSYP
jgi:hypothetical protein